MVVGDDVSQLFLEDAGELTVILVVFAEHADLPRELWLPVEALEVLGLLVERDAVLEAAVVCVVVVAEHGVDAAREGGSLRIPQS